MAAWLLAALLLAHPREAVAKERAIAVYVEGPDGGAVRAALRAAVPPGVHVVDPAIFRTALAERGHQKGPFGKQLDCPGRAGALSRLRKAAADAGADAVLVARVTREKNRRRVFLLFVDATGAANEIDTVALGPVKAAGDDTLLAQAVETTLVRYEGDAQGPKALVESEPTTPPGEPVLEPAKPPAPAAGDGATAEAHEPSHARPRGILARALFVAEADVEAGGRDFRYSQPITSNLRPYNVISVPLLRAAGELFPLADASLAGGSGLLRDVGVFGDYSRALFLKSSLKDGSSFQTDETAYMVGLRARIHPAGDTGTVIALSDAYAVQLLTFAASGTSVGSELPEVRYTSNRSAVDLRVPFGNVAGLVGLGYRLVVDGGPLGKRFHDSRVNGFDAELGAALAPGGGWQALLVAHYERYSYGFKPQPGDAFAAGGALDQFFGCRLGLAYVY